MHYRTNWALVIGLSLLLHGAVWGGIVMVRSLLDRNTTPPPMVSENVVPIEDAPDTDSDDNDLPGTEDGADTGSLMGEAIPETGVTDVSEKAISSEPETDTPKVEESKEEPEEIEPLTQDDISEDEVLSEDPIEAETEEDALKAYQKQVEEAKKDPKKKVSNVIVLKKKGNGGRQMGQPPITIVDSYPPDGMYTFKGVVRVLSTIGTNGKIIHTKIAVTSGNRAIDELAMAFCRRWTFKPALDGKGVPMECNKLIRIPFNLSPEKMKDQIDRNG